MAKGQMKSSREARKPKTEKPKKLNASNPAGVKFEVTGSRHGIFRHDRE